MPCEPACLELQPGWSHVVEVCRQMRLSLLDVGAILLALPDRFHLRDETYERIGSENPNSNPDIDLFRG